MLHPDTYRQWIAGSWPDSFYEGKWGENEQVRFIAEDGSGTLALIKTFRPYKLIAAEHIAILLPGGEMDTTSQLARNWIGMTEDYHFDEAEEGTLLTIVMSSNPQWKKMLSDGWPQALEQLKKICEWSGK